MPENKRVEKWLTEEGLAQPLLVIAPTIHIAELLPPKAIATSEIVELPAEGKLTIKHVRALLTALETTVIKNRRIIFIPAAERLLPAASNALLKMLEEASAKNRFLLTTAYPGRLLTTIRSRCEILRQKPSIQQQKSTPEDIPIFDPRRKLSVTSAEAAAIAEMLQQRLATEGGTLSVQRGLARLRDFYKAQAVGAGEKLASDALLASLINLK